MPFDVKKILIACCLLCLLVDYSSAADDKMKAIISVLEPAYCADVKGDTPIKMSAPGFNKLTVKTWKADGRFGTAAAVADVTLDTDGAGSFIFKADEFPHGPLTLTISGENDTVKDNCYLQLYNRGGVDAKAGIPEADPPAANGLQLVYSDDFNEALSIGSDASSRYYDHKPPSGTTDFSSIPFVSHDKPNTPFAQVDHYLRIRCSSKAKSAGLISSVKNDGSGFKVPVPAYFECRFIGPNAPGSWPAFWVMTDYLTDANTRGGGHTPCDELDIIEAYGGEGRKAPNAFDKYMISAHCWNQGDVGVATAKAAVSQLKRPIEMSKFNIPSTWFETLHTYGCLVTETETVYYCDDMEVGRHKTLPLCKEQPLFFMINLATGGGWPVDLSRYGGTIDMYVDYVRVYGNKK